MKCGYKCRHFVHIRVSQSAGSQQLAHRLSTPATLHTVSARVHAQLISTQPGSAAASAKFISSDKACKKITHLPSVYENRSVCVTGTEAL